MTALPTGIVAGNTGHISHHNIIHALLNPVDAPFALGGTAVDLLSNLPAAGQAGRFYFDATFKRMLFDDGVGWRETGLHVVSLTDPIYGGSGDNGITDNSLALVACLLALGGSGIIWIPNAAGAYGFDSVIDLIDLTGIGIIGESTPGVVLAATGGAHDVIQISGYHNQLWNLTLDGNAKTSVTGLHVKAFPQVASATRGLVAANLKIQNCKEALRLGHHSTLNGVAGDGLDPDLTQNQFPNLWIQDCDYGIVEDGQNVLENSFDGLQLYNITTHHVFMPRGGLFDATNAFFGSQTNAGNAKIETGAGDVVIRRSRSENGVGTDQPFLHTSNATTSVLLDSCDITNNVGPGFKDLDFEGGSHVVLMNCKVNGYVDLGDTDFYSIASTVLGGYNKHGNQDTKQNVIIDPGLADPVQLPSLLITANNGPGIIMERGAVVATSAIAMMRARDAATSTIWQYLQTYIAGIGANKGSALQAINYVDNALKVGYFGFATAAPTQGTWDAGTILFNSAPTVGQPVGWMCRASGTPGTWTAMANL